MNRFLPLLPNVKSRRNFRATRLLAVDWSRPEVRYVLVDSRRGTLSLRAAGCVAIPSGNEQERSPASIAAALSQALADYKLGRVPALIAIERAAVEWEPMSLPPATDDELPGLVRNQIGQQLPSLAEDATIDFFAVPSSDGSRKAVAVALPPSQLLRIEEVTSRTGLLARQIGIRNLSAATLVRRIESSFAHAAAGSAGGPTAGPSGGTTLAVDAAGDVVDLTLLKDGHPIVARTIRLAGDPRTPEEAARLVQEMRRSFVASREGGASEAPHQIVLFGQADAWRETAAAVREALATDVQVVDPFVLLGLNPPADVAAAGGFAGLLGMLVDGSLDHAPPVDFLNPKRPALPPNRRRRLVIAAAIAGAILGSVGLWVHSVFRDAEDENSQLAAELKDVEQQIKKVEPRKTLAEAVEAWQGSSVNWLDEIRGLSERLPPSRDIVVLRMSMGPNRDRGGSLTFQGVARDPGSVERMEQAIRDDSHEVQTPKVQDRPQDRSYAWQFETSVNIATSDESESPKPADRPARTAKGGVER